MLLREISNRNRARFSDFSLRVCSSTCWVSLEVESPTDHDQGQTQAGARDKLRIFVIEVARRRLWVGVVAGILGGGLYLLSQWHRHSPESVLMPTPIPTPTVAPTAIVASPTTILVTPTAPLAPTPQPTPIASSNAPAASPQPTRDPFEDGMHRVLEASGSGFLELRGELTKTEKATRPYPLFRLRKIYEGAFIFGGAYAAQLEEVYYSNANQPAYNYHLYFQESSDKGPRYDDLRGRLDMMLRDFVHISGTGYDAWAGSDARGTAVLLTDRDVLGSVEVKVHVAFPKPQW